MSAEPAPLEDRSIVTIYIDEKGAQVEIPDADLVVEFGEGNLCAKLQALADFFSDNLEGPPQFCISAYYGPHPIIRLIISRLQGAKYPIFFEICDPRSNPEMYKKLSWLLKRQGRWPPDAE